MKGLDDKLNWGKILELGFSDQVLESGRDVLIMYPICESKGSHVKDKGLIDGRVSMVHNMSSWAAIQMENIRAGVPLSQPVEPA